MSIIRFMKRMAIRTLAIYGSGRLPVSHIREASLRVRGYLVHAIYVDFLRNKPSDIVEARIDPCIGGDERHRVVVEVIATVSSPASSRGYFVKFK